MNNPLVSIICACYNQESYILEALDSIKKQTYQNIEIIIWDDASKDNSVAIIEQWIQEHAHYPIQFVKNETNLGICTSLNKCYQLSKGKYIQMLALDDQLLPDKLERHVAILEKSTNKDALVFSDAFLMDGQSNRYQNKFIALHHNYLSLQSGNYYDSLLDYNYIPAMSVLYKRAAIDSVGLWDEDLVFEDYDMLLRLAQKFDFIYDSVETVVYRIHQLNTHKTMSKAMELATFQILMKHSSQDKVKKRLFYKLEQKYLAGTLAGEENTFFSAYPPTNALEKAIWKRRHPLVYRLLKKVGNRS